MYYLAFYKAMRIYCILGFYCLFFLCSMHPVFSQEDLTITTFFPASETSYVELRAGTLSVGANLQNAAITALVPGQFIAMGATSRVGIGIADPVRDLSVSGSAAIGAAYAGITAAPVNGLIVEGAVGIGTNAPVNAVLDIRGATNICVSRPYSNISGMQNCPVGYYIMTTDIAAPPPWGSWTCCRFCQDDNPGPNGDGICD